MADTIAPNTTDVQRRAPPPSVPLQLTDLCRRSRRHSQIQVLGPYTRTLLERSHWGQRPRSLTWDARRQLSGMAFHGMLKLPSFTSSTSWSPQSPLTAINPTTSRRIPRTRSLRALPGTPTLTGWPIAIVSGRSYSQNLDHRPRLPRPSCGIVQW